MNHTQSRVTVFDGIYNNTDRKQIINLIQSLILIDHLFVYAEEMLYPAIHLCLDVGIFHMRGHFRHNLLHELFPLGLAFIQFFNQIVINIRLPVFQRQIIQLCLDLGNTEPLGNGRVNIHCLPGFFLLFSRGHKLQRPHIVKPVRQLDNDNADVLCHRKKHLAEILCLYFQLILRVTELSQLGHPVHKKRNLFSELPCDILQRHLCIFHRIVKHTGYDCLFIHFQVGQNNSHPQRMDNIGLS